MKKLTTILLFTSIFGYSQIDYKMLIKNLEDVTIETKAKVYFKDIPFEEDYTGILINDERFLRFYDIIIDKVSFNNNRGYTTMTMKPFDEKADYDTMKAKLIEVYNEPEVDEGNRYISYTWRTDKVNISLRVNIEEKAFISFDEVVIDFIKKQ